MSDQVLYLVRVISNDCMNKLNSTPLSTREITSSLGYHPEVEFPGVCASLVTKETVQSAAETLYTGKYMLFLDARLLRDRTDYHVNISDQNGYIGIDTLYPWNVHAFVASGQLPKAIKACGDDFFGTEVVFHNPIPWSSVVYTDLKWNASEYKTPRLPDCVLQNSKVAHFCDAKFLPYFALPTPINQVQNRCTKSRRQIRIKSELLRQAWEVLMQGKSSHYLYLNRREQNLEAFRSALLTEITKSY